MIALPVFLHQHAPNVIQSYISAPAATTSIIRVQPKENHLILKYNNTMLLALNDNSDIPPILPVTEKSHVNRAIKPKDNITDDKSANPYSASSLLYIQQKKANETTVFHGVKSV